MKSLDEIKDVVRAHKAELEKVFGVSEIGIFGSVVRGEAREDSDIDVLVEFSRVVSLLKLLALESHLQELLWGAKVDLAIKNSLKPYIAAVILQEVQYI